MSASSLRGSEPSGGAWMREGDGHCVASVLSIGISLYDGWTDIRACESEADLIASCAREHLTSNVNLIRGTEGHIPRKELRLGMEKWVNGMKDNTTHVFFYAGHGYEAGGDCFLVPSDSVGTDSVDEIKLSTLRDQIDKRRCVNCRILFFIAACRNNPGREPQRDSTTRPRYKWESVLSRYDNAELRQNSYLEFFACRPRETVKDDGTGECGPFARSLAKHLADKSLRVMELTDKVRDDVVKATKNHEEPIIGLCSTTMHNFSLHHSSPASEYSHGLAGPACNLLDKTGRLQPKDPHYQWRVRINRLTIESNIKPSILLMTDTGGKDADTVVSSFNETGMGPHYIVRRDGTITRLVEEHLAAWCGNPGFWGSLPDEFPIPAGGSVNEVHYFAVSIAAEGDGSREKFDCKQFDALVDLARKVIKDHTIHPWDVIGWSEVCMPPWKSRSPGKHFEWSKLVDAGLTFGARVQDTAGSTGDLPSLMRKWGYCLGGSRSDAERRLASFRDRYPSPGHTDQDEDAVACSLLNALLHQKRNHQHEADCAAQAQ